MSATPANDVQTPSAWNYAPNIQHFFELGIEKIKKNAKCNLVWGIIVKKHSQKHKIYIKFNKLPYRDGQHCFIQQNNQSNNVSNQSRSV